MGPNPMDGCEALSAEVVAIRVVDTSHGPSRAVIESVARLARHFGGRAQIAAGNVAPAAATEALIAAGVHAIKAGIGPGCFAAGTRILMANALYKNIEDVRPGDRVINMRGEPVTVVGARCTGTREVLALRHTAWNRETHGTPDHTSFVGGLPTRNA